MDQTEQVILDTAKICHEANRAYCQTIGDNSQVPWDEAPEWQKDSAIVGVRHVLNSINDPLSYHDAKKSHEAWLEEKMISGWRYGPVRDPLNKEHPCFLPWSKLPEHHKRKDYLFTSIARTMLENRILQGF